MLQRKVKQLVCSYLVSLLSEICGRTTVFLFPAVTASQRSAAQLCKPGARCTLATCSAGYTAGIALDWFPQLALCHVLIVKLNKSLS